MADRKKGDTRPDPATAPQITREHDMDRATTVEEHTTDRFWLKAIFAAIIGCTFVAVSVWIALR